MRGRWALVGFVTLAVLTSGFGYERNAAKTRVAVLENLARNVALPGYERVATSTGALQQAVSALCASTNQQTLDAARAAWEDAWHAWNETRVFRFAPPSFFTSGISYAADPADIDALAAGGSPTIGPPFSPQSLLQQTGSNVRGLEALGYMLFTSTMTPGRCSLASASADVAASTAQQVAQAWSTGLNGAPALADQLADPNNSQLYDDTQQAVDEIVNGMLMTSTEMTTALADTLKPKPAKVRSTIHTGTRTQDLLDSVQTAWSGDANGRRGNGIEDLVAAVSPSEDERVSDTLRDAERALKRLPPSLSDASPAQLRQAYKSVRLLTRRLDTEVASMLGVTITLSDADGDS